MSDKNNPSDKQATEWTDLAISLYDRLTGRGAAINYELQDMEVEVPRDSSDNSPAAKWRFNGTIRITTDERK